jgi:hypothetical protein
MMTKSRKEVFELHPGLSNPGFDSLGKPSDIKTIKHIPDEKRNRLDAPLLLNIYNGWPELTEDDKKDITTLLEKYIHHWGALNHATD